MAILPLVYDVLEKTTPRYSAVVLDDQGNPLPVASLTTLTLTLYVVNADGTTTIVNGRNAQSVLNVNNVTVDSLGNVIWTVQPADLTFVDPTLAFERHIALWQWTWSSGSKAGKHEVVLNVQNMTLVV